MTSGGSASVKLRRGLRRFHVMALALGCIIGFGCFVLPGDFLAMSGPLGAAAGVMLGAAAMVIIGRSYGRMITAFPVAGGAFAFAYRAAGRYHAALCGWLLTLGYLSIVPLNATALAVLANFTAPELFTRGYLYTVAGSDVYAGEILLSSAAIVLIGIFQFRSVRHVGGFQLALTALLVAAVLMVGIGTAVDPRSALSHLEPLINPARSSLSAVLAMLAISPWLFVGFDTLPQAAEEFDFPPERSHRLMSAAIIAGAIMYVILILATAAVLPWQLLLSAAPSWATGTVIRQSLGAPGVAVLVVAVCAAVLTGINGFYMASSRLLFSMGRAGVLPGWFSRVDAHRGTPGNAVLFVAIVSLIAPWLGRQVILWIVDVSAFGVAAGYFYTCLAALLEARRSSHAEGAQRLSAGAGLIVSAGFLILLMKPGMPGFMSAPAWTILAAWLVLGAALFLLTARHYRQTDEQVLEGLILGRPVPD